jgi:predicted PurR-regulated permease PerM
MQPLQKIYRLLLIIIISGLAWNILPFLASIIAMLIFSFLFTTIFLPSVDRLEKFLKSRILSVLLILSSSSLLSISFLGLFFPMLALRLSCLQRGLTMTTLS